MDYFNIKNDVKKHFDDLALTRGKWEKKNRYYHKSIAALFNFLIPLDKRVLEIGCGNGDLLAGLKTKEAVGIDFSSGMITVAKSKHPSVRFYEMDAGSLNITEKFDYIIAHDLVGFLYDIEAALKSWHKVCTPHTKIIITYYNFLWEPILTLAEKIGLKIPERLHNWLSGSDIQHLLYLSDYEVVKNGNFLLFPKYIPILSTFLNKYIGRLPLIKRLCLVNYVVAKPIIHEKRNFDVSVIVPARNEKGNIEILIKRLPDLGGKTEIIFIGGHSLDGTDDEIKKLIPLYPEKDIRFFSQDGIGKADAVRKGFAHARGEILMILDADLSVAPEDLIKFYEAVASGKGEFINGSRLVYPTEEQSMRFLNLLGNKFFGFMFSWLLDQRIKDTLCGTKVLFKKDYDDIRTNRHYFGDFDPFGDFDLLFGASKLNLKITELPVRYYARIYGKTNISRWRHGWLLLRMTIFAMNKIKFF